MEAALLLVTGILNIFLGGYVLYRNPRRLLNLSLSLFALGASGWILSLWFTIYFFPILPVSKITFISPIFIIAFLALFAYELEPKVLRRDPYVPILILLIPSVFFALILLDKVVTSVGVKNNHIVNTYGEAYPLYGLTMLVYIFGSLIFLLYKYYRSQGIDRLRLKYVLLGLAFMLIPSVTSNLILPLFFKTQSFNTIGPVSSTFMVIAMSYTILRYHLLDIWIVVRLGTIFTILFGVISAIYAGVTSMLSQYIGGNWSAVLASVIIVFTFEPLKKFIENKTDKFFFRKHYQTDEVINELTDIVHRADLELKKIISMFSDILEQYFKVNIAAIAILTPKGTFVGNPVIDHEFQQFELGIENPLVKFFEQNYNFILNRDEIIRGARSGELHIEVNGIEYVPAAYEELVRLNFAIAIPIEYAGKLIGIYFIGDKKSGDPFSYQDLQLLDHLTGEVGALINNARQYEDLKRLDEAKSNFISVVSHQLRTPLSAMRWTTELLLSGDIDKKTQQEFLKDTYKNSIFMIYHLDDMLTALDIEDKEIELKKELCNFQSLIQEILKDNQQMVANKKLHIDVDAPDELQFFCDCKKMKKIMEILISNGIHYAPEKNGKIVISAYKENRNEREVIKVSVEDNGIGITNEEQRYIFEKFFRGEEAKKLSPNGFGLGLFIVKSFAKAHSGDAYFESAGRDKGSRFYFTIAVE
jgi:hypothetical protein